jgi:uncharacterized protein DUF4397
MSRMRIGLAIASVAALGGCAADASKVIISNPGPLAYIRFINAIPDSGSQDWRFVDQVEGSPTTMGLQFRGIFPGASYQSAAPGNRHLKVFQSALDPTFGDPTKTTPEIVSTVFIDSTFNLVAGTHYTIIAIGNLRAPKTAKFLILTDSYTDPAANVGVRVVNASGAAYDVYGSASGGTSTLPSSPMVAAAAFTGSTWTNMAPGALALRANATGSKTLPALIDATAPAGVPADKVLNLTAIGGSTIAGSAFTAFVFPAAVTGSLAANVVAGTCPTRCTTPGIVFAVDKYPPSGF